MFTRDERRALFFLAAVTVAGGAIRAIRGSGPGIGAAVVAPALVGEDLVRQAALSRRAEALARPLGPGERVDVDRAAADELERLPRVGRSLARRIVADRDANGRFGSLVGLVRVPGVSAGVLRDLERYVTFGGNAPGVASPASAFARAAPAPERPAAAVGKGGPPCSGQLSLSRATKEELACLPGIGRVLAERIVADRTRNGAFKDIADLARVPGIGRVRIERLRGHLTIP